MLERESGAFLLRPRPEITLQGALEERRALRYPRHLIVDDQRRRPIDLPSPSPWDSGCSGMAVRPVGAAPARLGPVDAHQ